MPPLLLFSFSTAAARCILTDRGHYVGVHASGFRDFLLKPEILRAIVDCGFEHPSEGTFMHPIRIVLLCAHPSRCQPAASEACRFLGGALLCCACLNGQRTVKYFPATMYAVKTAPAAYPGFPAPLPLRALSSADCPARPCLVYPWAVTRPLSSQMPQLSRVWRQPPLIHASAVAAEVVALGWADMQQPAA